MTKPNVTRQEHGESSSCGVRLAPLYITHTLLLMLVIVALKLYVFL